MVTEIDHETDDLDDVARKIKEEFGAGAAAVQITGEGYNDGGFDREGWMFTDVIGAIEMQKHRMIAEH